jgi:putative hemolysin
METALVLERSLVDFLDAGYHVTLARSAEDLDAVTRLRYEVFNLELGSGLTSSHGTGHDRDHFDLACDHLMVRHLASNRVVGTYRLQTAARAAAHFGFYCANEFDPFALPPDVVAEGVELGRACVHHDFRNRRVLLLLWRGLASYLRSTQKRYLFGCCSLPTICPIEARAAEQALRKAGAWHPTWQAPAADGAEVPPLLDSGGPAIPSPALPALFRTYLRFGATVCGGPVIDRMFGTVDFFVVLDRERLTPDAALLFSVETTRA